MLYSICIFVVLFENLEKDFEREANTLKEDINELTE